MVVHMPGVEKLPQVSYLSLRVVPHQVHVEVRVGFIWRMGRIPVQCIRFSFFLLLSEKIHSTVNGTRSSRGGSPAEKKIEQINKQMHSPYLVLAVDIVSTAAHGDSPPPMTRMTSTLYVSSFSAVMTRL